MENFFPLIILLVVVSLLIFGFYFSKKQVILRALGKTKSKPISRIQDKEYAKIIGLAKHVDEPLIAPLSGRKCIYYQVIAEKKGSKNSWHTVIDETKSQDFFIERRGEMAIVKVQSSSGFKKVYLDKDHNKSSGFFNPPEPKIEAFLTSRGGSSTNFLGFKKTMRFKEGIIELDEKIAVLGVAKWKTLKEPIEGFSYSKILTLSGIDKQKLLITDIKRATQEAH